MKDTTFNILVVILMGIVLFILAFFYGIYLVKECIKKRYRMKENPLVSVIIATHNASQMLTEYSLPSVMNQTYKNLEIIVVDDGSIDDTEELVSNLIFKTEDSRVKYHRIENPGYTNWYATGTRALDKGSELATGEWISYLDDDDWYLPNKIETILEFNKTAKAEILHHPFLIHYPEAETFRRVYMESLQCSGGNITTSTIFCHKRFKNISFGDDNLQIPGDWNKCKQILELGGVPARVPDMLLLKNGHRECSSLRNRVYRPKWEPGPYKNIKNEGK